MPDDVVPATRVVPRRDVMFVVVGEVDLLWFDARIAWSPGLEYDSRRPSPTGSRVFDGVSFRFALTEYILTACQSVTSEACNFA